MDNFLKPAHPSWHPLLIDALQTMDASYLNTLIAEKDWLPGVHTLLAAFSISKDNTRFILLGESPYPRIESANGYAFWDANVTSLWSDTGLNKTVNRATSLRNWLKMLLCAEGYLQAPVSQPMIASLNKQHFVQTAHDFFSQLIHRGFLLLNASLVYKPNEVPLHARKWRPFIHYILQALATERHPLELILFGRIAEQVPETTLKIGLRAEHPYNLSFITNPRVLDYFAPLELLKAHESYR